MQEEYNETYTLGDLCVLWNCKDADKLGVL